MNLNVTKRISGGFGIIVLFLMVIAITSYSSISGISQSLDKVVDEMSPMALLSAELKATMLEVNQNLTNYDAAKDINRLDPLKNRINDLVTKYQSDLERLKGLSSKYPEITDALVEVNNLTDRYVIGLSKLYEQHNKDLSLEETLSNSRGDFEDLADELDTAVYDLAEATRNRELKAEIESLNSLASEGVVATIDTFAYDQIADVEISVSDMDALAGSIKERLDSLAGKLPDNEGFAEIQSLSDRYLNMISGSGSLLSTYIKQLEARASSTEQIERANQIVGQFIIEFSSVISGIGQASAETKNNAQTKVDTSLLVILLFGLVSIAAAVLIAYWVVQSIRKPLHNVNQMLQVIAQGDLTQQVEVTNADEFGELSGWVNSLVESQRQIIEQIKSNTHKLSIAAEHTSQVTNQTNQNINQQRVQTNSIADSMSQMAAAVEEVSQSANSTATEVDRAHEESTAGSAIVASNINSITQLAEEIDTAADVINQLDEFSNNIGNVLDVIRGIAEQTNLLALNAAIEAARAGEQGRGFAVVADEVRTLASRTQESTSEIQEMIERLQTGAHEAVKVMQSSKSKAASSVEEIQKAGELLATITDGISIINDMSAHIASAAEEQASVTEEVHKNITSITEIAEQTAKGAEDTMSSSIEVARLSEDLKHAIDHFKVN